MKERVTDDNDRWFDFILEDGSMLILAAHDRPALVVRALSMRSPHNISISNAYWKLDFNHHPKITDRTHSRKKKHVFRFEMSRAEHVVDTEHDALRLRRPPKTSNGSSNGSYGTRLINRTCACRATAPPRITKQAFALELTVIYCATGRRLTMNWECEQNTGPAQQTVGVLE